MNGQGLFAIVISFHLNLARLYIRADIAVLAKLQLPNVSEERQKTRDKQASGSEGHHPIEVCTSEGERFVLCYLDTGTRRVCASW